MNRTERNICWYSAFFIALMVNAARLLALREDGVVARYWQFNIFEYGFQFLYNYFFCIALFVLNLSEGRFLAGYRQNKQAGNYYFWNGFVVVVFILAGAYIQHRFFGDVHQKNMLLRGYTARFVLSSVLVAVFIRIVLLIRESKRKDLLNADLKASNLQSQLALLQSQLNPHFLFNSLSSLSGIVRENPPLAQHYILHLSKIFRNAITHSKAGLVSVSDELNTAESYVHLVKMRLEDSFQLEVDVAAEFRNAQIPHLALQTLLENAAKHNIATKKNPLTVRIYVENQMLIVANNLQPITFTGEITGTGLANLNERYHLLTDKNIDIICTDKLFMAKLPLVKI